MSPIFFLNMFFVFCDIGMIGEGGYDSIYSAFHIYLCLKIVTEKLQMR